MTFRFPFASFRTTRPVPSLAGRFVRPRPVIPITVFNPLTNASLRFRAVLDSGSDDTVFHNDAARALGIDLANAIVGQAQSATGTPIQFRFAEVALQIADFHGQAIEWRAIVAFAPKATTYPLLGFAGFMQYFDTTIYGELEEVELTPNILLPGQQVTVVGS